MPLAATLATDEIWQAFLGTLPNNRKQFFHGHTYGGNPLAAAAALASLDVFDEEQMLERAAAEDRAAGASICRASPRHPHVGDVRQCGLIAGIELVRDRATKEPSALGRTARRAGLPTAREEGVMFRPLGNVVVIMPPLAITLDELDRILLAVEHGIEGAFRRVA